MHTHILTSQSQLSSTSYDVFLEGNLNNICKTISIDISVKHGIVEHIQISADCSPMEIQLYITLFTEFRDVFAWPYKEMPSIDPLYCYSLNQDLFQSSTCVTTTSVGSSMESCSN